ncbi:MAG: histidinol dehydrogenase [Gammaproteobacteria bacterium]|nr:histidinol dehydrogenase [Gammaproteobacteria bacterium]
MAIKYLKKASKKATTNDQSTGSIVTEMLSEIERDGEAAALKYSEKLDGYNGPVIVDQEHIENAKALISDQLKSDIAFAYERVTKFAQAQRDSISDFETEVYPGMWCAQKLIPLNTAGCYVPGGRYAHVASAIMSIATAKVAGVKHIVACSAPKDHNGIDPGILYTMDLCGADHILNLGGVQGIAAMAQGLFTGHKADILVGPGNRFVAEAKRQLFGRVGIDLFAGPTEILVIADETADPHVVAVDLVGQAEHGLDSPCWLISTSEKLANEVMAKMDGLIQDLPETARVAAEAAWNEYGEVVLCDTDEEAALVSDEYAAEHLELQTANDDWFVNRLTNYGSLFVGEETTVAFGDKCSGTNHILPTKGAAKYTGGLSVHKYFKIVTTQRMTREANREVAAAAARISRLEGMEAHARTGDIRLEKYFSS